MSRIVGVDVGGTFTDVIAVKDGVIFPAKVATNVASSDLSVLEGAAAIGVSDVEAFNLASTAGLNAVITRRVPKIGLLVSQGGRDTLDAGTVGRPVEYLTDPTWHREFSDTRRPLVPRYLRREVPGLLDHHGRTLLELDEEQVRRHLRVFARCEVQGVAVSLARAWKNPVHELRVLQLVRDELGDIECCISSDVSPMSRAYSRGLSTVINVFMRLLYKSYTERLGRGLAELEFSGKFNYADCRAMLVPAEHAMDRPYRLVAGGPAGGTVSSAHFGTTIGDGNLICADVGGTSCDISVVLDGKPWVTSTFELEYDMDVNALSVDIVTLGAGGGSIVNITSTGDVRVGPDSAGADPGPACYGKGGTRPATTDTALLIGILDSNGFLGGSMKLDAQLSRQAFEALDAPMSFDQRVSYAWRMASHNIAEGILNIAIRRGVDTRDFSLVAFGAAGPMMLPSILDLVPMRRVIVPPYPGLFSALGLLSSDQVFTEERGVSCLLDAESVTTLESEFAEMEAVLAARLVGVNDVSYERSFDARLLGQGFETPFVAAESPVSAADIEPMSARFHRAYEVRNGNTIDYLPIEVVSLRVNAVIPTDKVEYPVLAQRSGGGPPVARTIELRHLYGEPLEAGEYQREELLAGDRISGPAVVREAMSTTFVPPGRGLVVGAHGELVIS